MVQTSLVHSTHPETYIFLGVEMRIHLSGRQTGGKFSLIEGIMPPGGDGGLHLHTREDESMYLLEGELEITVGERTFTLAEGQSYFAPRNVPHRIRNCGKLPVRTLLVNTPGSFDEFVRAAGIPVSESVAPLIYPPTPQQVEELLVLAEVFGVKVLASPELALLR